MTAPAEPTVGPWKEDHSARAEEGDQRRVYLDGSGEAVTVGACGDGDGFCFIVWDRAGDNVADEHCMETFDEARDAADKALRERGEVLEEPDELPRYEP